MTSGTLRVAVVLFSAASYAGPGFSSYGGPGSGSDAALGFSRAEAEPRDPVARAEALVAATKPGTESQVSCDGLDEPTARALLELVARTRDQSFDRAIVTSRLAARAGECLGSDQIRGTALVELSAVLKDSGNLPPAMDAAKEAVRLLERTDDRTGLARAWNAIATAKGNDVEGGMKAFEHALEIARSAGNRTIEASVLNNLANGHRILGDLATGIDELTAALTIFEDLGDKARSAVVVNNIALNYYYRGDYQKAIGYNVRAIELNREVHADYRLAGSLDARANIYRAMGAYRQALDTFQQALALRQKVGDKPGVMETTNNIGLVHYSQGDYELAIDAFRQALQLNRSFQDDTFTSEALRNIGASRFKLGQLARARANLEASLDTARRAKSPIREGQSLNDLGELSLAQGRLDEADRQLRSALEVRKAIPDGAGITETFTSLASLELRRLHADTARQYAEQAAASARDHDQAELLWNADTALGIACRRLGHIGDARAAFTRAIDEVETLSRAVAGSETLRQRFVEDKLSPYQELIDLDVRAGRSESALELAERSKARVLARLVRRAPGDDSAVLSADEQRERARLQDAVFAANQNLATAQGQPGTGAARLAALEQSRRDARKTFEAFETLLAARHPELARTRATIDPVTRDRLRALLPAPDALVIEFVVSEHESHAFAITAAGSGGVVVKAHRIPIDARDLSRRADALRDQIADRDFGFRTTARELYDVLLRPFAPELAHASQLMVIPDGPLWNVPFQALIDDRGYILEQLPVSYAPSLTVLGEILKLPRHAGSPTLLAMGRSDFADARPGLENLPEASKQVRQLGALYGPERAATYMDGDATERRFKRAAPQYSVLHLATHGVLDESSPLYSYLVLARDHDAADDGRLEAWEIMRMKLSADLVVLASCDTGRGRIAPGEGVIGTMWALFAGGARAMVVSGYRAEAGSSTTLLVDFHRRLVASSASQRGASKAASLRQAALTLLHSPRYAHPYYWSAFMLVGDPR